MEIKKPSIMGCKNPRWNGGEIKTKDGRVMVYCPDHPSPSKGRYVYRYRRVMENHLGRFLKPDEIVHHKNGKQYDDRIENLQLTNHKEHGKITLSQMLVGGWSMKRANCIACDTNKVPHKGRGFCEKCYESKRIRK